MQKKIVRRVIESPELTDGWEQIPDFLCRAYRARGVNSLEELEYTLARLATSQQLKGVVAASKILADAVRHQRRILVVGDFDCDGATSTSVAVLALKMMGAAAVEYLVPNRFEYGYGLTPEIVEVAKQFKPDVIVTVDNGIASCEGVAAANQLGISVVVTDHHLPGNELPDAAAIVNPNQPGCDFISKATAGVGVIFYVMSDLRRELRECGWFAKLSVGEPNLANLLDLVALGTIADVVPLDSNNRILVEQGIRRIRAGKARPGILALIDVAGKDYRNLAASDLGFVVGPRLNAAGRLDDMSIGIECLLCDDPLKARQIALRLDELNQERKQIEGEMKAHASVLVDELNQANSSSDQAELPWGMCLYDETWHQGVIGILASRMKEKFHRPVIAFAPADDECKELKGSARSIPGLHIRDALDRVATRHPSLLSKFGGHSMAAGMTIKGEHYESFSRAFDEVVREELDESNLEAIIVSDGELAPHELNVTTAELLRKAGPWGQNFLEPVYDGVFDVVQARVVGAKHLKLLLQVEGADLLIDGIEFNSDWVGKESQLKKVRVAYRPDVNEFRGRKSLQLMVQYLEAV
ncbi:single-stranded-DNA-specific exonuclease RecJ [Alkalimarinus sediminis]|uniref:Single-stranded-DNA-specific exonuclease RecJ n=1 Tax=Alkalimarinus sediminis TaxID=1632866 RepID=A0A9E8KNT4_9ALTE|nr:single-stranded-DNA-specific exonuclease RecJ [Alkalimarinus sediminis]UZW73520.1 single-stranded-DNA-specific exonuclease RecJ [Alkalimarinus sediminis]